MRNLSPEYTLNRSSENSKVNKRNFDSGKAFNGKFHLKKIHKCII